METTTPRPLAPPRAPCGAFHARDELDLRAYFAEASPLVPGSSVFAPRADEDALITYVDVRTRLQRVEDAIMRLSKADFLALERHYGALVPPHPASEPRFPWDRRALDHAREKYAQARQASPIRR
ncbi:MAG TPA: hypothetical protein VGI39_31175 [Polyangiaceae bacterium]|jgi:hypothetical protein